MTVGSHYCNEHVSNILPFNLELVCCIQTVGYDTGKTCQAGTKVELVS